VATRAPANSKHDQIIAALNAPLNAPLNARVTSAPAPKPQNKHAQIIAALNAPLNGVAAKKAPGASLTPAQQKLAGQLRAAYVNQPGSNLLGGKLQSVSQASDPLITMTEKLTAPFTMPQKAAGSLIGGDPLGALKNIASLGYKGPQKFPSQALHDRGLLKGDSATSLLLGLGADVAPSLAVPGFKGAGRAAGLEALRGVSKEQRLPLSEKAPVPRIQTEARAIGKKAPGPQRAVRRSPSVGPDLQVSPKAKTVRMNPVEPGTVKGGRPKVQPNRRVPVQDMPYAPNPRVQGALDKLAKAVREHKDATATQPTRVVAAAAGRVRGAAQEALAAAERTAVLRIRRNGSTGPRTVGELRQGNMTPVEVPAIPGLRTRVEKANVRVEKVTQPGPTVSVASKAAQKLTKSQARVAKAEKNLWKSVQTRDPFKAIATDRQTQLHRDAFTSSHEREWITANLDAEHAAQSASAKSPLGVNVQAPWNRGGKGATIPVTTAAMGEKVRSAFNNGKPGEALAAYRHWVVSRYGPHPAVRQAALAADDVTNMHSAQTAKFIRQETKAAGLTNKELDLASGPTRN